MMSKKMSTGYINYNVSIYFCSTEEMIKKGYIDKDTNVVGLCRRLGQLDYMLVFNSDYEITEYHVLHEVYHLFFEVLNDIGRYAEYSASELCKDIYYYMFVDMFKKAWSIISDKVKKTRKEVIND